MTFSDYERDIICSYKSQKLNEIIQIVILSWLNKIQSIMD